MTIQTDPERLAPSVARVLESFDPEDWSRRTGYLHRAGDDMQFQLRAGHDARRDEEYCFHDFGDRYGFSWLEKPNWS